MSVFSIFRKLPLVPSDDTMGSSTFFFFPIASSIFDSRIHTIIFAFLAGIFGGLIHYRGVSIPVVVGFAVLAYTLALTAFEFGDTVDMKVRNRNHSLLLVISAVAVPVAVVSGYYGFQLMGEVKEIAVGMFFLVTWFINREIYVSMKEDIHDLNIRVWYGWLYVSRIPFIGLIAASVVTVPPFFSWVTVGGVSIATAFVYGLLRVLTFEPNINNSRNVVKATKPEEISDDVSAEVVKVDGRRGERGGDKSADTKQDEPTPSDTTEDESDGTQPGDEQAMDEDDVEIEPTIHRDEIDVDISDERAKPADISEAQAVAEDVADSVGVVNRLLENRDLESEKLPTIDETRIPPDPEQAIQLFNETQELSRYLAERHEEDQSLRLEVLNLQQHLQELDEYIYTEVGTNPNDFE